MSPGLVEMDCGLKCRSKKHAAQMITAVTKGNSRQTQLFLSKCHNVGSLRDMYGRTVLHVASSCGKVDTVRWLLTERGADLSVKDIESGWTALHRALFYGQLSAARLLVAHGANLEVKDKEGLAPLDILMKDRLPHVSFDPSGLNEVYTWGDNSSYTLGQENEQKRRSPECVELFRRKQVSIKQVIICRYHSTFLTTSGLVYTCGNGHGGRLGHGDQQTCLAPRLVEGLKEEVCVEVAAARDHTMFLTQSGTVYSCGLNEHRQLGVLPSSDCCLLPKPVSAKQLRGHPVQSIHALRFHSVVHATDAVFTFGHNAGQLGHQKVPGEHIVAHPRLVSALNHKDTRIRLVAASDAATIVVTTKGDVFALHKYRCRKVASRCEDMIQVAATGGSLDSEVVSVQEKTEIDLTVLLLSSSHRICIWQSSSPVLRWCSWSLRRPLDICQFAVGDTNVAFVTRDGDAFLTSVAKVHERNAEVSTIKARKCENPSVETSQEAAGSSGDGPTPANAFITMGSDALCRQETEEIDVSKITMVHRATFIALDKKARNFAVLQTQPNASLTEIPVVRDTVMGEDLSHLLEEADITDNIHDVILQIGSHHHQVAAHKFILASQSEYFRHMLCDDFTKNNHTQDSSQTTVIELEDVDYDSFSQILRFIYTGTYQVPASKVSVNKSSNYERLPVPDPASSTRPLGKGSAYKVYKNQNVEQEKGSNGRSKDPDVNPLRTLLELAGRFGIKQLKKRLEAQCGVRGSAGEKHLSAPNVPYNRRNHQCLYDVCIEAEDKSQIQCHKCVLVARLDYFRSMLGSSWIEASNTKSLSLPIARDVLKVVIDYLYVDTTSVLSSYHSTDLLCSVLTVADQLLIGRLKDMCEVALAALMNLKNACELLQFASVYSAHQLKESCQQFISINAAALLETRSLDVLSDDVIDELGVYYRDTVPGMCRRMLTPYDGWPDMTYLESLEAELQDVMIDNTASGGQSVIRVVKRSKKRRRTRSSQGDEEGGAERATGGRLSLSSDPGDMMEQGEEEDTSLAPCAEDIEICPSRQNADVSTPFKDVSITPRKDISKPQKDVSSTPLKDVSIVSSGLRDMIVNNVSSGLRDIIAEEEMKCEDISYLSPSSHGNSGKKTGRVSQKQRKKLARESNTTSTDRSNDTTQPQPTSNPWGVSEGVVVKSFKELQLQEVDEEEMKTSTGRRPFPRLTASTSTTWGLSAISSSQKEVTSEPVSPMSPVWSSTDLTPLAVSSTVSFTDIVQDAQQQREAWQRAANKPLSLIQIEEQAMQELLQHYRAADSADCLVAVERVSTTLELPVWAKHQWHGPH